MTNDELSKEVQSVLHEVAAMFKTKNEQYRTDEDALSNFTRGALLMGQDNDVLGQFETLKAYVAKHIAHVYANKLDGQKVDESITDIIVYFVLAKVMAKKSKGRAR